MIGRIKFGPVFIGIALSALLMITAGCAPNTGSLEPEAGDVEPTLTTDEEVDETPMSEEEAPLDDGRESETPAALPEREEARATLAATPQFELVPTVPETSPVVGELPESLLQKLLSDLAEKTGRGVDRYEIVRAEAVVWSDGSLGCPQPGQMYTQALVEGYWVVIQVEGEAFDYRTNGDRSFILCPDGQPLAPPPAGGTPTS